MTTNPPTALDDPWLEAVLTDTTEAPAIYQQVCAEYGVPAVERGV